MIIGIKTRIYPTREQENLLFYHATCSHKFWNFLVAKFKDFKSSDLPVFYKNGMSNYSTRELINDFLDENKDFDYIIERVALDVIRRYCDAWRRTFSLKYNAPKFHKYNPIKKSFCVSSRIYSIKDGKIPCPATNQIRWKIGYIPINITYLEKNKIPSISNPMFSYNHGKWYVSGTYDNKTEIIKKDNVNWLGLDYGYKNFFTTSDGEFINYPSSVKREFYRIAKINSKLHKKKRGSNNYNKLLKKLQNAHKRQDGIIKNFIDQKTTELCRNNNIVIEDLANATFKKSTKNLKRSIIIAPHFRFVKKLSQKSYKFGTKFIKVNPAFTSMSCSGCDYVNYDLKQKDRIFECPKCGLILDRDVNASINIRDRGIALANEDTVNLIS